MPLVPGAVRWNPQLVFGFAMLNVHSAASFDTADLNSSNGVRTADPGFNRTSTGAARLTTVPPAKRLYRVARRRASLKYSVFQTLFDKVGAACLLTASAPVMLFVAVGIKLTSPGPILFRQRRLTRCGQVFVMYKFRTMVNNAERNTGAVWAAANDPRVTPFGQFLRNSRLDELPQLLNVLKGEMSIIGPRPERPELATKLAEQLPSFRKRLQVNAGLTGLAQVGSGYAANVDSYREKLAWDILYIRRRSILLDLLIAVKTVRVMLTGRGAR